MKIEHIALYVSDIKKSREFFEKYFGAKANDIYDNTKTGFSSYFLSFDGGARLEIMNRPECAEKSSSQYSYGYAHIAIAVGSREKVDMLTARLEADGYTVCGRPRTTGDGYYESVVLDGDGNLIEITE